MIGILTQNNVIQTTLLNLLAPFQAETYTPDSQPDIVIVHGDQRQTDDFLATPKDFAVILLGTAHPEADAALPTPCAFQALAAQIERLENNLKNAPNFENKTFLFEGHLRRLTLKATGQTFRLTEKENDLLIALIQAGEPLTKEQLLTRVWHYRPDTETHTVETHIYTLRQKIGTQNAATLIANTAAGYILVTD